MSKLAISEGTRRGFSTYRRLGALLLLLVVLGVAGQLAWRGARPNIAGHPQYRVSAEAIHITPPPAWIRSDIKSEVLRDAGLSDTITVLEDWNTLAPRLREAFEFHPWVASVERITRRLPASLEIELKYRCPIAAVESRDSHGIAFLPIDERGVRLPEADLTEAERRYLPRISGVGGRPLIGDAWGDRRVIEGAKLVAALLDVWQQLKLVEIVAATRDRQGETASYMFEIVTTGGTRIVWGAPPGQETEVGEMPSTEKRKRLLDYAGRHGKLDSIEGPAAIDVRKDLVVTPRTARRKAGVQRK